MIVPNHRGDLETRPAALDRRAAGWNGRHSGEGRDGMQHYYAVAEPDDAGGFWISFPGRAGITSAADERRADRVAGAGRAGSRC